MRSRSDHFCVHVRGSHIPERTLVAGTDFRVDLFNLSDTLSLPLRPLERDLARLAASVYAIDRLEPRDKVTPYRYPGREIEITCGVSDVAFWRQVEGLLVETLRFLGGDQISLRFLPSSDRDLWSIPASLWGIECDSVALNSGGLDSAAGLVSHLASNHERIVSVTAEHQPHQQQRVLRQYKSMPLALRSRVIPTFTRVTLMNPPRMSRQERTQRLRGFLFTALGGIVASRLGVDVVNVFENGVGAVNVPPVEGMCWGGLSTRGSHPAFLRLMARIVSAVADRPICFDLPFKWSTKGEVVQRALRSGGTTVLEDAVSCVHYPLRERGPAKQCGLCPGCLGHQLARHVAGLSPLVGLFRTDPRSISLAHKDAVFVRLLRGQAFDLQQLRDGLEASTLHVHLDGSEAITPSDTLRKWIDLHLRYADQVDAWFEPGRDVGRAGCVDAIPELVAP